MPLIEAKEIAELEAEHEIDYWAITAQLEAEMELMEQELAEIDAEIEADERAIKAMNLGEEE